MRTATLIVVLVALVPERIEINLNAAVVNETGLTGRWNYVISSNGLESGMQRTADGTMREYPSIFKAVEEQLGLKLERRRDPHRSTYLLSSRSNCPATTDPLRLSPYS